jgi:methyl-accepting chemotaxis protein
MKIWKNRSLKIKLILSFIFISCGAIISSYIQFSELTKISSVALQVSEVNLVGLINLSKMESALKNLQLKAARLTNSNLTLGQKEEVSIELEESLSDFTKYLLMYKSGETSAAEIEQIEKISGALSVLKENIKKITDLVLQNNKESALNAIQNDWASIDVGIKTLSNIVDSMKQYQSDSGYALATEIRESSKKAKFFSIGAASFFFILSIAVGFILSSAISKKLTLAAGNSRESVQIFSKASNEIFKASDELAEKVNEQAASLQNSVSALNEVSAMIEKVVDESESALSDSIQSEKQAIAGKNSVEAMLGAFNDVGGATQKLTNEIQSYNENMSEILKSISAISDKTQIINEIVFQTKLLSFNASVEAARAGEHGKGFSIVAVEIGNLAQMSGTASSEISQIINESYERVQQILKSSLENSAFWTKDAKSKLDIGLKNGAHSLEVLEKILVCSSSVAHRIQMVSTAIREQQKGITEINTVMIDLDRVSSFNRINANKTREIANHINKESETIETTVCEFEKIVYGRLQLINQKVS